MSVVLGQVLLAVLKRIKVQDAPYPITWESRGIFFEMKYTLEILSGCNYHTLGACSLEGYDCTTSCRYNASLINHDFEETHK